MTIRDFQQWTAEHDRVTGWDAITPLQILAHLTEEMGEIAQSVNRVYDYRGQTADAHRQNLKQELVDTMWFLTKIANRFGIDLEQETQALVARAESWPKDKYRPQLMHGLETLSADLSRAKSRLGLDD